MGLVPILILKRDSSRKSGPAAAIVDQVSENEQRIAMGVVYFPNIKDTQGDWASEEEVRKAAYEFMRNSDMHSIDVEHDGITTTCYVVESFIARKGDPDFTIPGSWVIAVHIPDDVLWLKVKSGVLNGFSLEAMAKTFMGVDPIVDTPTGRAIKGKTGEADGHSHAFTVELDDNGKIIATRTSPYTDPKTGKTHSHALTRFSRTETEDGHLHRFTLIEQMYKEPA